ncbi:MAG: 3-hydroxyacyl-ACP dehydratase FabZ [Clostridia bacterium]|nr:3-hydroxyacyl-ACP dehydratase FabZ [Clostridia bacterium]
MNKEEIKGILPHREDMLLLDEVELVDGVACGKKKITGDEFFLRGHFPQNPVVPGVILCEILAQSVCVCLGETMKSNQLPYFTGLDKVKFKKPVVPGDVFETRCEITRVKVPFYFAKGSGYVNGKLCVSAEFSFAITG